MSSIKIRTKRLNGNTQIRTLITHPMENGRHKDKQGKLIPAHHIRELWVEHNKVKVITCHMAGGISKNPYFDFLLKGGEVGDVINITWVDNQGKTDSKPYIIK
ncbi:MAG: thiosulfate oxidation carrier complex protein SoxZ [Methylococcales bacterium]|nr:thiosulfate oxidation carrier complex protein SoxZ [Methylococcales bacterium]